MKPRYFLISKSKFNHKNLTLFIFLKDRYLINQTAFSVTVCLHVSDVLICSNSLSKKNKKNEIKRYLINKI